MSEILKDLYHHTYPLAQRLKLVGSWALAETLHQEAITEGITVSDPTVLYCGTATANNPQNAEKTLIALGYDPSMAVVDIASKPLERLPEHMVSAQTSGVDLPFDDDSFDIITTDFLSSGASVIAFTNDGAAANIFTKEGFKQESLCALPRSAMKAIFADRIRTPLRARATARTAFHGGKRLFVRP